MNSIQTANLQNIVYFRKKESAMDVAKDTVRISVPFAAGVLLSALVSAPLPAAAVCMPLAAMLIAGTSRNGAIDLVDDAGQSYKDLYQA